MRWVRNQAFTFVEILAALAFLGILVPVVISALMTANRAGVAAERSALAVTLAENQMAELIVGDAWTATGSRGDFGTQWPGYRWELRQDTWNGGNSGSFGDNAGMTQLTLSVFFPVQGQERSVTLSTLVSQSVSAMPGQTTGSGTGTGVLP